MSRRFARIVLILAILLVAILAAAAMVAFKPEPPKKEPDLQAPLVEVLELSAFTTRFGVQSQGTVRPRTATAVSAEVTGTIEKVAPFFIPGGHFRKDQSLVQIDPTNFQVAVDRAAALLHQRQIEFDGAEKLRSQGYRAEAELAAAATALASARAELADARRNLDRTSIKLPFDGLVRTKDADLGQFVTPGTRIGSVFATDVAEVRLPLTDQDLALVSLPRAGDVAAASVHGPDVTLQAVQKGVPRTWPAQIVRTEGVIDESSRVTYAVAQIVDPYGLHNGAQALPMGTFVSAVIQGNQVEGVFRVPRHSLRGSDELLFVDQNEQIRIRAVEVIHADAEFAYVRDGASDGDRIVLTTLEAPFNGMPVRARAAAPDVAEPAIAAGGGS